MDYLFRALLFAAAGLGRGEAFIVYVAPDGRNTFLRVELPASIRSSDSINLDIDGLDEHLSRKDVARASRRGEGGTGGKNIAFRVDT